MSSAAAPSQRARYAVISAGTLFAGRYRMNEVLGEGTHSVVYAARDESKGGEVALKVIHRHLTGDPQVRQRFEREAKTLARLEGEHVVRMLDFVEDDGLLAIALERIDGPTLESMLARAAPLPIDVAIEVSLQVCAALGAAHANGIVHRDLKTANVLVERAERASGATAVRVKVVDFGLCRVLQGESTEALTEHGMIFGTAQYMAPEQARGDEVDARADLYAVGVMLYEMTVGLPPFSGRTAVGTMTAHLTEVPPSPRIARPEASITPALEAVMLRALAKEPGERFGSARELATAIAAARDATRTVTAPPPSARPMSLAGPQTAEELGAVDTELHLDRSSFASAITLRAEELAARLPAESAPVRVKVTPAQAMDVPAGNAAVVLAPKAVIVVEDEPTVVSGEAPRGPGRYLWVLVAVVAAVIGVTLGVLFGSR